VQGVSSVLRASNGDFLVMSDNGFGAQGNSADYVLRVYRTSPQFKTRHGGSGAIDVEGFFTLRDPWDRINFPIVAEQTYYPNSVGVVEIAHKDAHAAVRSGLARLNDARSQRANACGCRTWSRRPSAKARRLSG
jgi:hypothetical protein